MNEEIKDAVKEAVAILRNGGVILYPTDTVWGIGCDATNADAVARVCQIKKRGEGKSMVVLAKDVDMVCQYVKEIPEIALQLIEVNDKPMTIIYPDAIGLADNVVAEDGSVAIRIPLGGFCLDLVRALGRPLVSTSANISGEPAPKCSSEISSAIRSAVDYTVDPSLDKGGSGAPSSIIKVGLDFSVQVIRK